MTNRFTLLSICRSVIYILWSSDFVSYLEDYLMEKCCTWDSGSLWLKDRPCKIYVGELPIFHGPSILQIIMVPAWGIHVPIASAGPQVRC